MCLVTIIDKTESGHTVEAIQDMEKQLFLIIQYDELLVHFDPLLHETVLHTLTCDEQDELQIRHHV